MSVLICAKFHEHRFGGGWKFRRKAFPLGLFVCNQTSRCLWSGKGYIHGDEGRCHGGFPRFPLVSPSSLALHGEIGLAFYVLALNYSQSFNKN